MPRWGKIWMLVMMLLLLAPLLTARSRPPGWDLSIYGSLNLFLKSGSKADYKIGVNEFPVTASHTGYGVGAALHTNPRRRFSWGITLQYFLDGESTIEDPVDDDRADVKSHAFLTGFISAGYRLVSESTLSLSLNAGAGGYYLLKNNAAEYTSGKGYILEIEPMDKNGGFAAFVGLSIDIWLSRSLALLLQSRYLYLASPADQGAVLLQVGFTLAL